VGIGKEIYWCTDECDTEIQKEKPRRKKTQLSYERPDLESNRDLPYTASEMI
jgi:hypothetical protein